MQEDLNALDEDDFEQVMAGALLTASAYDDAKATRIYLEKIVKWLDALSKKKR